MRWPGAGGCAATGEMELRCAATAACGGAGGATAVLGGRAAASAGLAGTVDETAWPDLVTPGGATMVTFVTLLLTVVFVLFAWMTMPGLTTGGALATTWGGVPTGAGTMIPGREPGGGGTKHPYCPLGGGGAL